MKQYATSMTIHSTWLYLHKKHNKYNIKMKKNKNIEERHCEIKKTMYFYYKTVYSLASVSLKSLFY